MRGNERSSWSPRAAGLVGSRWGRSGPSAHQPCSLQHNLQTAETRSTCQSQECAPPPPPSRIATKRHPPTFSCLSSRTPPSLRSLNIQLFQTLTSGHCAKTLYMLYLFNIHNPTYILKEAEAWRKRLRHSPKVKPLSDGVGTELGPLGFALLVLHHCVKNYSTKESELEEGTDTFSSQGW